jgi:hypothetical protein
LIETHYACDDYPRTDDEIGDPVSSAVFLRAHEAHRLLWSLADWRASTFAGFIADVQNASGLDDEEFEKVWRHMRFLAAGQGRFVGIGRHNGNTDPRLGADRRLWFQDCDRGAMT